VPEHAMTGDEVRDVMRGLAKIQVGQAECNAAACRAAKRLALPGSGSLHCDVEREVPAWIQAEAPKPAEAPAQTP
jgi:hypothetical protein